jgi:hypothetical protein
MGGVLTEGTPDAACVERADDLAHLVYRVTWKFMHSDPDLAHRMRTAAITLAAWVRGRTHGAAAEPLAVQATVALGEMECCIRLARRVGLVGDADLRRMHALQEEVSRALMRAAAPGSRGPWPKDGGSP